MYVRESGRKAAARTRSVRVGVAIQYNAFCDAQVRERGATTDTDPKYNLKMRSIKSSAADRVSARRYSRIPKPDAMAVGDQRRKVGQGMTGGWADAAVAGGAFEEWNPAECPTGIPAVR